MNPSLTPVAQSRSARAAARAAGIQKLFRKLYGEDCRLFRAPGRINLIGEHTDYNDGLVMPAAVDLECWVAVAPAVDRTITVHSDNFSETRMFHLDRPGALDDWSDYVQGVALMLEKAGCHFPGAKMLVSSEVPVGSGLSSSAALEVSTGLALLSLLSTPWPRLRLAQTCQRAENEFVGARCGIMDQFVSCHAKAGHLVMLDCRSLEHRFFPVPADTCLVISNTMVKHINAAGEYNVRRAECEEGARLLACGRREVSSLRDLELKDLDRFEKLLPPAIYKRCRHVVTENQRVLAAAAALEDGDLERVGSLMRASHQSLSDDYEVSCPELNLMVELASAVKGVYGARMTGGGFGGCTVNLVDAKSVGEFITSVTAGYQARLGIIPEIWVTSASEGAGRWEPS